MNTDLMVKMVNEISAFFAAEPDHEQAARGIMLHIRRYWDPRMRTQLIEHWRQRRGAGLQELGARAVEMLDKDAMLSGANPGKSNSNT